MDTEDENEKTAKKPEVYEETTETIDRVNESAILALKHFIDFLEQMKFEYLKRTETNNVKKNSPI